MCLVVDLTGSQDGCVRLWEWGHSECISEPRKPGAFPKTTKVLFNSQGNKVLYPVSLVHADNAPKMFLSLQYCYNFIIVAVSSLLSSCCPWFLSMSSFLSLVKSCPHSCLPFSFSYSCPPNSCTGIRVLSSMWSLFMFALSLVDWWL